jgi:hypothetical protein
MNCVRCGAALPDPPWFRRDLCPRCDGDLRACIQCGFYAPGHYNECREPQAERVTDKERANTCDYFRPASGSETVEDPAAKAKAELDKLFKK